MVMVVVVVVRKTGDGRWGSMMGSRATESLSLHCEIDIPYIYPGASSPRMRQSRAWNRTGRDSDGELPEESTHSRVGDNASGDCNHVPM